MKTLIFGPDTCLEMGWLICAFIPAMRHVARKYDKVVAIVEPGHEYLYEFATDFEHYSKKGKRDRWLLNGKKLLAPKRILKKYPGTYYAPSREKCTKWPRKYRMYGSVASHFGYDIVIHARNIRNHDWIDKKCGGSRNWGLEKWACFAMKMAQYKMCCVGTEKGALHIPGCDDKRGIPLHMLCDLMASSRVVVGESSGPLHLASLCGTPHVVITDDRVQKSINATNKQRYRTLWNHFQTACRVVEDRRWNPAPAIVAKKVEEYLCG